jgi:hypothetical protein
VELPLGGPWCQRWTSRRHSWRHRSEGGFDPQDFAVEPLAELAAKRFVTTHHYSQTYPASSRRFGLYLGGGLAGVAVFGIPMQMRALTLVFPELIPVRESLECSRFVLLDEVPGNGESWFLARCFEALAAGGIRGVLSFADPVLRRAIDGRIICPGHLGTFYQASNGHYLGRSTPRTIDLLPDGTTLSARALQKVRRQERGHAYVERLLISWGAPVPRAGVDPTAWLADALDAIGVRQLRHPGNHRYAFPLGTNRRERRDIRLGLPDAPYPKHLPRAA